MRQITILGSTGSIGTSTLDVVARHPDKFRIVAVFLVGLVQLFQRAHQRFSDIDAAVGAEVSGVIGIVVSQSCTPL